MLDTRTSMEDILNRHVSGYHQYILSDPPRLCAVSQSLCDMTGYTEGELLDEGRDGYLQLVHPSDRALYADFLADAADGKGINTHEYRLIKKDGAVLFVRDALSCAKDEDGTPIGHSVLTDVTDIKRENENLQFLNETVPCGFLKYTCEKQPRITYINQKMAEMLRFPKPMEGEADYAEMLKSNIFLMIPMEDRRRFSKYLNRVYSAEAPIAGEVTLLRCDGTRAHVFGWVTKCVNDQGVEEFQSVCMDVTARHQVRKTAETQRYIKALTDVYDKIFEFNIDANTVKCLHCEDNSSFKKLKDISMQIDDALEKWILESIAEADRADVLSFFADFSQKRLYESGAKPPQIAYRARSSSGETKPYRGIFIKVDDSTSFYCCRLVQETQDADVLRTENIQLKQTMKDLVMQFSDGIAAFEIAPNHRVKPLYASRNVCEFFGYTQEEWMVLSDTYTPLETFVSYSEATYEAFAELLRKGEAEYSYFDYKTETERKIKAICSRKDPDGDASRYVMLYAVENTQPSERAFLPENRTVSIRTFGYFDVFVGDTPIAFRNKKSKELFAILVDRRGGFVTSEEAISYLWEDEPASALTLARYRKVALRLKNTLEEYGISAIVESVDGKRRIVPEKLECDLYNYLSGKAEYASLFKGSYLTNYSWAETTLGELTDNRKF